MKTENIEKLEPCGICGSVIIRGGQGTGHRALIKQGYCRSDFQGLRVVEMVYTCAQCEKEDFDIIAKVNSENYDGEIKKYKLQEVYT